MDETAKYMTIKLILGELRIANTLKAGELLLQTSDCSEEIKKEVKENAARYLKYIDKISDLT